MLLCPVWYQWWTGLAIKIYRSYLEIPEPFHLHSNVPSWIANELTAEVFILSHHQCPRQKQHKGHVLKFNRKMWWLSSTFLQIKCKFLLLIPFPLKDQVGQLALKLTLLPVVRNSLDIFPFHHKLFHQRWDTCTSTPIKNTQCFIWYGSYSGISSLQYREKIPWNHQQVFADGDQQKG